jgi:hypothetical protein
MWQYIFIGVVALAGIISFLWLVQRLRRPKLSERTKQMLLKQYQFAESLGDPARKILEADKVLDSLLNALGYQGTLGEKLKKAGNKLPNIQGLWNAHKLRNRIAHEHNVILDSREVAAAMNEFKKAIYFYQ